jgi:ribonuclease HI
MRSEHTLGVRRENVDGGVLDPLFKKECHVLPPFTNHTALGARCQQIFPISKSETYLTPGHAYGMIKDMDILIHFDGSCWPNPGGLARYGFTLRSGDGAVNHSGYGVIGENPSMSNNHAELYALACGLEYVLQLQRLQVIGTVRVVGDSEVAVRLMSGRYRANREKLYYPQYVRATIARDSIESAGGSVEFDWIPRAENQECDDLSKMPVDTASAELKDEAEDLLADLLADLENS